MRLDSFLVKINLFDSRTKAKQAIERSEIRINDAVCQKCSFEIDENKEYKVEYVCEESYVSLGGYKLKKALTDFNYNVNGKVCIDIGASTGGFTDCLIKNGAKKVYAVDLNDTLLHKSLVNNEKVIPIIKNVKNLTLNDFTEQVDLIVADLSFISITLAIPVISSLLSDNKEFIALIKPQFESGEKIRFKNGIIRDKKIQLSACVNAYNCALENNLTPVDFTTAPISQDKNIEFLMKFIKNGKNPMNISQIKL